MPLTLPRQVSPEYGTRIESAVSSAVPVRAIPQLVRPGAVAVPCALQAIVPVPVSEPWAVPATFRSPAHDALNDPLAVAGGCSVTLHLKSVHEAAAGMMFDELQ